MFQIQFISPTFLKSAVDIRSLEIDPLSMKMLYSRIKPRINHLSGLLYAEIEPCTVTIVFDPATLVSSGVAINHSPAKLTLAGAKNVSVSTGCSLLNCGLKTTLLDWPRTRCARRVMTLIFYLPMFLFFKPQCYPLQNSSLGQLHTDGDVAPTFAKSCKTSTG